jgi:Endonuclease I
MEYHEFYSSVFEISLINNGFFDVYSGKFVKIEKDDLENIEHNIVSSAFKALYNVEHIIPGSIYNKRLDIFYDLHNTVPSIKILNDFRSNLPINSIPADKTIEYSICEEGGRFDMESYEGKRGKCAFISSGIKEGTFTFYNKLYAKDPKPYKTFGCAFGCYFQPVKSPYLGLIARAILYFHGKYLETVKSKEMVEKYMSDEILETMKRWDVENNPTEYEINRNYEIFKRQGTSNPFFRAAMNRMQRKISMKNLLKYAPEKVFFDVAKKI